MAVYTAEWLMETVLMNYNDPFARWRFLYTSSVVKSGWYVVLD